MLNQIKEIISNPENLKRRIFIRAVPAGYRGLDYCVYKKVGDLCLALFFELDPDYADYDAVAGLPEPIFRNIGLSEDEIWALAAENTIRIYGPSICAMGDMMLGLLTTGKFLRPGLFETESVPKNDILVFSAQRDHGPVGCVSMLFFPEIQKKLSSLFGGDFYAVFMTNMEAMLHPVIPGMKDSVKYALDGANEAAVDEEERLSSYVWRYFSSSGELTPVA